MRELFCGFTPAFFGSKAIKFVPGSRYRKRREGSEQDKSAAKQCNFILMMELRKKITTCRDIIDLPLCSTTLSTDQMILGTMHDLHKYYPESIPRFRNSKLKRLPLDKLLIHFCKALQELVDVSDMTGEGEDKCKLDLNDNEEPKTVEQIVEITVATLNGLIKIARDKCDMNDEDEDEDEENDKGLCQKVKPCKENGYYCTSPTSVLTEFTNNPLKPPYPSPLMLSVNVQAVGKLSPIDVKRLQLHMLPAYRDEDPSFLKQSNVIIEEQENGDVVDENGDPNSKKDQVSDSNAASGDTTINESEVAPITPLLALPPDVTPHPELPGDEDGSASPPSGTQTQVLSQIPPPPPQSNGEVTKPTSEATEPEPPSSITALEEKTATGVPSPPPPPLAPSKPNIRLTTAATPPPPAPLKSNIGVTAVAASPTPTPPAPTEPNIEIRVVAAPAESNIEVTTTTTVLPTAAPKEPNIEVTAEVAPSAAPASTPGEPNIEVTTSLPPPPPTEPNIDVTVVLPPPPTSAPTELNIEVTTSPPTEQNVGVITALPPPTASTVEKEAPLTPSPSPPQAAPTGTASGQLPPPPPPMMTSKASGPVPPPPPMMTSKESGPVPPPPPMMTSKASGPVPPPPPGMSRANGAAPPPPAFGGLSLSKATTKLKRSSHMGNLYRSLKGKVEGFPKRSSSTSNGRKGGGGAASGGNGKQGMADALEEMTKRSTYFIQIEEDAKKYEKSIKELKTSIGKFKTSDMSELIKFHKYVESILENLTDESQVLAKFEGFPGKKLEALRTAAALYLKLESMLNELHNMKIEPPLIQLTEKVERYFDKIKKEIDSLERTKDEEAKKLKGHNIEFNFQIILRIKEAMVDVSSNYMELVLKGRRESKLAANEGFKRKGEAPKKVCTKVIWRTFQFAFRVYTFAGGHDDRADRLTRELAHEIECDPEYSQL